MSVPPSILKLPRSQSVTREVTWRLSFISLESCARCGITFDTTEEYRGHTESCQRDDHVCPFCPKFTCGRLKELARHVSCCMETAGRLRGVARRGGAQHVTLACPFCTVEFYSKSRLRAHLKTCQVFRDYMARINAEPAPVEAPVVKQELCEDTSGAGELKPEPVDCPHCDQPITRQQLQPHLLEKHGCAFYEVSMPMSHAR